MPTDTFVARRSEDLIVMVPYLLGFHPAESLVLLTFAGRRGAFHARVDLPHLPENRDEVVATLVAACRSNRTRRAAVVAFTREPRRAVDLSAALLPALRRAGVDVVEAVRADGSRWWSLLEPVPLPHPYDPRAHPFTAERVLDGQAAFGSREELARSIEGDDVGEWGALLAAAGPVTDTLAGGPGRRDEVGGRAAAVVHAGWLRERIQAAVRAGEPLPTADAGRVLALVQHVDLRDVAWAPMSRDVAAEHVAVWRDLVRRAPDELLPPAAALLAFAAWLAGDGALAWCAVDRCLAVDPEYSLAHRVADLLHRAVPPGVWEPFAPEELPLLHAELPSALASGLASVLTRGDDDLEEVP